MSGSDLGAGWRRHPALRAPYRRRWLSLLATVATVLSLVGWLVQLAGADQPPAQPAPGAVHGAAATVPAVPAAELVTRAAGEGRVVSLTFDDGPDPQFTPRVLALLARYGAVATFCMVGLQALRYPELVRQVAAAGMRLCAHSLRHDEQLGARSAALIEADVAGSKAVLITAVGADVRVDYFRAPAGNWTPELARTAAASGMRPLSWSVDSRDWARPGSDTILTNLQADVRPGAVILLHDGGGPREQTLAALESLLPWLLEQGYTFAPPA